MSPPCVIQKCSQKSRAICHCCNYNFCIDHLKEPHDILSFELDYFLNEINTLTDRVLVFDAEITDKCHQKLDKWRDDCHMMIDRYYEEKHQQLQQRYIQRADEHRKDIEQVKEKVNKLMHEEKPTQKDISTWKTTINDIKDDIKQFEEQGILIDTQPLIIDKDLIQIEGCTSNEIDISTLPPPIRKMNCDNSKNSAMASNKRYLLMEQYPNLCLFDKELTLIKQYPWKYDRIQDMCWSSTLNSFIIITVYYKVFLVNEDMTLVEPIKTIEQIYWTSCTCSGENLFLVTNLPTGIFQFDLLSSFNLIKQWNTKKSRENDEFIANIAYNHDALALLIKHGSHYTKNKIELRSSRTFDYLWSLSLDLTNDYVNSTSSVCSFKYDQWLVIDHKKSNLLQISKNGELKVTKKYHPTLQNAVLFGSNILVITTTDSINFYNV